MKLYKSEVGIGFSFVMYVVASVLKLTFGILFQSAALMADGLNSLSDVFATTIMFFGVRVSKKPKDENHRYGHQRYEQIASIIAVVVMMFAGFEALRQGFFKLFKPENTEINSLGIIVSLISAAIILLSAFVNWKIFTKIRAMANKVIFFDNIGDAIVSLLTAIALVLVFFNFSLADPIASILIGVVILKSSYSLLAEAAHQLSDGFDSKRTKEYMERVQQIPGVLSVHELRGRTHGIQHYLELTIKVNSELSLVDAHNIAEQVEHCLLVDDDIEEVIVHYEP